MFIENKHYKVTSKECWDWIRCTDKDGYGLISIVKNNKRTTQGAHRRSYMNVHGVIPAGQYVLHKCDNVRCINPEHLFIGTQQDNMDDMRSKKAHYKAKISAKEVIEIRVLGETLTHKDISERYNLSRNAVTNIVNHRRWNHVK